MMYKPFSKEYIWFLRYGGDIKAQLHNGEIVDTYPIDYPNDELGGIVYTITTPSKSYQSIAFRFKTGKYYYRNSRIADRSVPHKYRVKHFMRSKIAFTKRNKSN